MMMTVTLDQIDQIVIDIDLSSFAGSSRIMISGLYIISLLKLRRLGIACNVTSWWPCGIRYLSSARDPIHEGLQKLFPCIYNVAAHCWNFQIYRTSKIHVFAVQRVLHEHYCGVSAWHLLHSHRYRSEGCKVRDLWHIVWCQIHWRWFLKHIYKRHISSSQFFFLPAFQ